MISKMCKILYGCFFVLWSSQRLISGNFEQQYPIEYLSIEKAIDLAGDTLFSTEKTRVRVLTAKGLSSGSKSFRYKEGYGRVEIVSALITLPTGEITRLTEHDINDRPVGDPRNYYFSDTRELVLTYPGVCIGSIIEYEVKESMSLAAYNGQYSIVQGISRTVPIGTFRWVFRKAIQDTRRPHFKFIDTELSAPEPRFVEGIAEYAFEITNVPIFESIITEATAGKNPPYFIVSSWNTWDDIGKWWYSLYRDKLDVNDSLTTIIHDIVIGMTDNFQKAKAIAEWVRDNVRYVAVELGKGGVEPREAGRILSVRYGDCKDKTILTMAMLRYVGIESYPVLVCRSKENLIDDCPSQQFDHVIACVKMDTGKVFFDPTASHDFGYIDNRLTHSLQVMIVANEAVLVRPCDYLGGDSITETIRLSLQSDSVVGSIRMILVGKKASGLNKNMSSLSSRRKREAAEMRLRSHRWIFYEDIRNADMEALGEDSTLVECEFTSYPMLLSANGNTFINLATFASRTNIPTYSFLKNGTKFDIDESRKSTRVELVLGPNYRVLSLPSDVSVSNSAGVFERRYELSENSVVLNVDHLTYETHFNEDDYVSKGLHPFQEVISFQRKMLSEFVELGH